MKRSKILVGHREILNIHIIWWALLRAAEFYHNFVEEKSHTPSLISLYPCVTPTLEYNSKYCRSRSAALPSGTLHFRALLYWNNRLIYKKITNCRQIRWVSSHTVTKIIFLQLATRGCRISELTVFRAFWFENIQFRALVKRSSTQDHFTSSSLD